MYTISINCNFHMRRDILQPLMVPSFYIKWEITCKAPCYDIVLRSISWGLGSYDSLTLILARISNYIRYKVWNEIPYPFPKLQQCRWSLEMDK